MLQIKFLFKIHFQVWKRMFSHKHIYTDNKLSNLLELHLQYLLIPDKKL